MFPRAIFVIVVLATKFSCSQAILRLPPQMERRVSEQSSENIPTELQSSATLASLPAAPEPNAGLINFEVNHELLSTAASTSLPVARETKKPHFAWGRAIEESAMFFAIEQGSTISTD